MHSLILRNLECALWNPQVVDLLSFVLDSDDYETSAISTASTMTMTEGESVQASDVDENETIEPSQTLSQPLTSDDDVDDNARPTWGSLIPPHSELYD